MSNKKYYTSRYSIILVSFITIVVFVLANLFYLVGYYKLNHQQNLALNNNSGKILGANDQNVSAIKSEYMLIIPEIRVQVPVILDVDAEHEYKYFKALENGVAQMKGTAKPGEIGNTVIFGHSSLDIGAKGDYGEVFAKLNDLKKGDKIQVINTKDQSKISYKVFDKKIVMPEDTYVIDPTDEPQLTLLTCWPIGSDQKRLVVFADLEK